MAAAAVAPSPPTVRITGVATVVVDHPSGTQLIIDNSTQHVIVDGLDSEISAVDLASGDTVSVMVSRDVTANTDQSPSASPGIATPSASVEPLASVAAEPTASAAPAGTAPPLVTTAVPGSLEVVTRASTSDSTATAGGLAPAGTTVVTHDITIVRASWPGSALDQASSLAAVEKAVVDSADYWRTVSGGSLDFNITQRFDAVTLSGSPCLSSSDYLSEISQQTGWTSQALAHIVIAIPKCTEDGHSQFAGWGSLGAQLSTGGHVVLNGSDATQPGSNGNAARVLAHELGHNLSLMHSSEVICGPSGAQVVNGTPTECRAIEYGGVYSVMGSGVAGTPATLGGFQASLLGFLGTGDIKDVLPSTTAIILSVPAAASAESGRFVRVSDSDNNVYYVEYRMPVGLDSFQLGAGGGRPSGLIVTKVFAEPAGTPFKTGVDLYGTPIKVNSRAIYMLDANPASNPNTADATQTDSFEGDPILPAGVPLELGDVDLVLLAQTDAAATLQVSFGDTRPPATKPTKPESVTAKRTASNSATVSWSAPTTNGGTAITGFTATSTPGGFTCTSKAELSCTITGLAAATTYSFTVTATNAVGTSDSSTVSNTITTDSSATPTPTPTTTVAAISAATSAVGTSSTTATYDPYSYTSSSYVPTSTSTTSTLASTGAHGFVPLLWAGIILLIFGILLVVVTRPRRTFVWRGPDQNSH